MTRLSGQIVHVLFLCLVVVRGVSYWQSGMLSSVVFKGDSLSYVQSPTESLSEVLKSRRTPAYPLLVRASAAIARIAPESFGADELVVTSASLRVCGLRASTTIRVRGVEGKSGSEDEVMIDGKLEDEPSPAVRSNCRRWLESLRLLPSLQLGIWLASLCVLYYSLVSVNLSPLLALAFVVPPMWNGIYAPYCQNVMTEMLAMSLVVCSVSFAARFAIRGASSDLALMVLMVLLGVLTRPALLVQVVFTPLIVMAVSVWGRSLAEDSCDRWKRYEAVRRGAKSGFGLFLVVLGYASLRLLVVGDFGIVSMLGSKSVIAVELLSSDDLIEFTGEELRIAEGILVARDGRNRPGVRVDFEGGKHDLELFQDSLVSSIYSNADRNIWGIAIPVALKVAEEDPVRANRLLSAVCRKVIANHRAEYVKWWVGAVRVAIGWTFRRHVLDGRAFAAIFTLMCGICVCSLFDLESGGNALVASRLVTGMALAWLLINVCAIPLVARPVPRYCDLAALFVGSAICVNAGVAILAIVMAVLRVIDLKGLSSWGRQG